MRRRLDDHVDRFARQKISKNAFRGAAVKLGVDKEILRDVFAERSPHHFIAVRRFEKERRSFVNEIIVERFRFRIANKRNCGN